MAYLGRLLRGNIRLIALAVVASIGFFFTEFWRNVIQDQLEDIDRISVTVGETVKKISLAESQRDLMRYAAQPEAAVEIVARAEKSVRSAPDAEFIDVANGQLAARERLQRVRQIYINDADTRSIELTSLATAIGSSAVRPRHMVPIELPGPAYQARFLEFCHAAYWPDAPQIVKDSLAAFKPEPPPAAPKTLAEQFIYLADDDNRLYNQLVSLGSAIDIAINSVGGGGEAVDPRKGMAAQGGAALRGSLLYAGCIDSVIRSHTSQLIVFLRNYQAALMETRKPIAEHRDWLRYIAYCIAIIAFFASNLKPAAPPKSDQDSVEADSLAAAGSEKPAIPADAAGHGQPCRPASR